MKTLTAVNVFVGKENPTYESVNLNWFTKPMKDTKAIASAKAADLAFIIKRHNINCKPSWRIFNQFIDQTDQEETSVVFFPIINAPAHEIDTLNTLIQRCIYVSSKLNQSYTVITVDQVLFYYRLIQLKFVVPEYKEKLIVRLGGLHISMNFLGVIGNHTSGSGLTEAWLESNLLGSLKAGKAMNMSGKEYNKAVRAHKLTYQALWRLLYPQFYQFLETPDPMLAENLRLVHSLEVEGLMTTVSSDAFNHYSIGSSPRKLLVTLIMNFGGITWRTCRKIGISISNHLQA